MRILDRLRLVSSLFALSTMAACGSDEPANPGLDIGPDCDAVAWESLLTVDAPMLSAYRLFSSSVDPTAQPNGTGMPYDLNTDLFTDYASKYRFVFIPCGLAATYVENEVFDFPIGTVIAKTFAMPADTGDRGPAHESLIETRLLIHRSTGWVALPYTWLADGSDAVLDIQGASRPMSVTHRGTVHNFNYEIPSQADCAACHTLNGAALPIGPKARHLNGTFDYGRGPENQLDHWRSTGQMNGLPADLTAIATVPVFTDDTDISMLNTEAERNRYAKGYLDVNCAHCHRPGAAYGDRTPYYEFWRDIDTGVADDDHGICRVIQPGNAAGSGTHVMMRIGLMPRIGTSLVHQEGLALLGHWIANMSYVCP